MVRQRGTWEDALAQLELAELLAAAETVLAATGNAVALCPAYGQGS